MVYLLQNDNSYRLNYVTEIHTISSALFKLPQNKPTVMPSWHLSCLKIFAVTNICEIQTFLGSCGRVSLRHVPRRENHGPWGYTSLKFTRWYQVVLQRGFINIFSLSIAERCGLKYSTVTVNLTNSTCSFVICVCILLRS